MLCNLLYEWPQSIESVLYFAFISTFSHNYLSLLAGNTIKPQTPLIPSPFDHLSFISDSRLKGKRVLVYLSHSLSVQVFMAPPGVGLLYEDRYLEFDDWFFMQCTNCVSFKPGLLAVAKLVTQPSDMFKYANQGLVSDCFLCAPQYVFEDCGKIKYALKRLRSDSTVTITDIVMGTLNAAEMLFSEHLMTFPVDSIDIIYLNRITGHESPKVAQDLH